MKSLLAETRGPPQRGIFDLQSRKLLGREYLRPRFSWLERHFLLEGDRLEFAVKDAFDGRVRVVVQLGPHGQVRAPQRIPREVRDDFRIAHADRAAGQQRDLAP